MNKAEWVRCPACGNKTRTMMRADTELKNFPLYCPKCKKETLIGDTASTPILDYEQYRKLEDFLNKERT
ncbi:MAG: cysteine-rich KTR domain-containing protein [Lachnospiraceae bacterium]